MITYLLHFDRPVRGKSHYIGSCEDTQLPVRLRRHQLGTASKLTRQAHKEGVGFYLTRIWVTGDRTEEYAQKKKKNYKARCAFCNPQHHVPHSFAKHSHFAPVAPKDDAALICF